METLLKVLTMTQGGAGVHEEAMLAAGTFTVATGPDFDKYLPQFMPFIRAGLQDHTAWQVSGRNGERHRHGASRKQSPARACVAAWLLVVSGPSRRPHKSFAAAVTACCAGVPIHGGCAGRRVPRRERRHLALLRRAGVHHPGQPGLAHRAPQHQARAAHGACAGAREKSPRGRRGRGERPGGPAVTGACARCSGQYA